MTRGPRALSVGSIAPSDPDGVIDASTARRAMAAAVVAIGRSPDPLAEFSARQAVLEAAMAMLGREFDAKKFLESCGVAADAITAPDEGTLDLPSAALDELVTQMVRYRGADPETVRVTDVIGGELEGYDFTLAVDGVTEPAFGIEFEGRWVFAPGPVGREDLVAVTVAFRRHFDFFIAVGMHMRGASDDAIASVRDEILPTRALPMGEADAGDLSDEFPLVFELHNPTSNGRGWFCGYDPFSGETRVHA